jgi:hypothetical protein
MKRWAVLTVLLYALALLLLTTPVMLTAFGNWGFYDHGLTLKNASHVYRHLGYWFWLAVLIAGQASLLLVPINIAERRLPARRPLEVPILVTGFFLANLLFAGLLAVFCAAFKEEGFGIFSVLTLFKANEVAPSNLNTLVGMIVTLFVFWFIWAMIFQKSAKSDNPDALLKRSTRWLLRGSILELLVAVPSHIIVRRRDDCCAPAGTFWGIATGISVMLLCFGPGVFFLFVERFERLKPKPQSDDKDSAPTGPKSL